MIFGWGGGAVWIGSASLEGGGRQVRWHSSLWAELKKIG